MIRAIFRACMCFGLPRGHAPALPPAPGEAPGLYSLLVELLPAVSTGFIVCPMSELDYYDYELPRTLIAQSPLVSRADARLLVADRRDQSLSHHHIRDLPELLQAGDCLVLNETRVVPARLLGRARPHGGHWEGLFLQSDPQGRWRILCKARGKLLPGETIVLLDNAGPGRRAVAACGQAGRRQLDCPARHDRRSVCPAGADRPGPAAALHPQGRDGRVRPPTVPDGLCPLSRSGGGPDRRIAIYRAAAGALEKQGVTLCRLTLHVGRARFGPSPPRRVQQDGN